MNELLRANDIKKDFYQGEIVLHVLKGVDLAVNPGEIVSIVGPSGVGKSTLLHILGGLDKPTSGEVLFAGTAINGNSEEALAAWRNRNIGFIFQLHHLLPEFTALENVMLPMLIAGRSYSQARKQSKELLEMVGLGGRLNHRPAQLSGGEQQRVALARALINKPRLVLADEPTGNLNSEQGRELEELMESLNKTEGITFIIVTHNELFARQAHRCFRLEDGVLKPASLRS